MGQGGILLVLEEQSRRDAVAKALEKADLEVVSATAKAAANGLGAVRFDVVIGDVDALGGNPSLLAALRQRDPDVEAVVVAGAAQFADALKCLRAGAGDVIAAPPEEAAAVDAALRAVERRRSKALAREAYRLARHAVVGELAAGIVHDIANPVTVLSSSSAALNEDLDKLERIGALARGAPQILSSWWQTEGRDALDEARQVIREAGDATDRLKLMTRDLRAVTRGDPGAVGTLDVADAVETALRVVRNELGPRAEVKVAIAPHVSALASAGAVIQALVLLLTRTAQALAVGGVRGHVIVRGRRVKDAVEIEVEDDAPPGDDDPLARLLAAGVSSGAARPRGALGVAVARDLVERQAGGLRTQATADGTLVVIRLPAAPMNGARKTT